MRVGSLGELGLFDSCCGPLLGGLSNYEAFLFCIMSANLLLVKKEEYLNLNDCQLSGRGPFFTIHKFFCCTAGLFKVTYAAQRFICVGHVIQ